MSDAAEIYSNPPEKPLDRLRRLCRETAIEVVLEQLRDVGANATVTRTEGTQYEISVRFERSAQFSSFDPFVGPNYK